MGPLQPDVRMDLWWRTGWIPVMGMPYAWYSRHVVVFQLLGYPR
jgi:hypothetical protein